MKKVTQKEVRSWMVELAKSQGLYGRLLREFDAVDARLRRKFMKCLHEHKVHSMLDFAVYIEGDEEE